MNLSRPFILRPIATSLLMAALLIVGIIAFRSLPVSALPQVDYPTIQVATFYPGASPEVVGSSITAPMERTFGQLPGLNRMSSSSSAGCSMITLQFVLDLNIDIAEQQVQAAVNAAQNLLPRDLPAPPIYSKVNPADAPILTLALTSKTLPLSKVQDAADTRLSQKISQVPGVGLVSLSGGQKPAVRIQANPTALASYGLSMTDLRTAIGQSNVNQAKGSFDGQRQAYAIGANDQLLTSEQYMPLVIAYKNGAPIRLSDVATAVDGVENQKQAAWMGHNVCPGGKDNTQQNDHMFQSEGSLTPAIILNIQRQPGANTIAVVDRVKTLLPQLKMALPTAVDLCILTDRTTTIRASVEDVEFELLLTIGLVVAVIFVFLRTLSATIIPSIAVPLSIVGTFAVMYLLGYSLNNLTLMALTISTGFVADDAIVMIENIMRYVEEGERPMQAALKGAGQIGFTILSLTIALIAVLIPLLFMGDVVGRLFREFAITLSVAILVSAVVSLTLTPMMCARLLKHHKTEELGRFHRTTEHGFQAILDFYERTLGWVLKHQTTTLWVAVATLATTVILYLAVPKGFFPVQDTGVILGISEASQTISFDAMAEKQQALAKVILQDPAVESISSFIGIDGSNVTPNSGRIQINLKPHEKRDLSSSEVIRRLGPALEKCQGIKLYMQPVQDLSVEDRVSRTQYQFSLEDANEKELAEWSPKLLQRLQDLPELTDVASDQQRAGQQILLTIDRPTASRLGITPQMLDDALYDAFGQRQISTLFTQMSQYRVVLEAKSAVIKEPQDLLSLTVKGSTGPVPLGAFTRMEIKQTALAITHQGQFACETISFNLAPGISLGTAVQAIEKARKEMELPNSIKAGFQGTAQAFSTSMAHTPWLILAAVLTVYILLGVLYESYIHPVTILSTLPSAGVGALLSLMICRTDFSVIALIGIILLIGIVAKNAIMMIDFALEEERKFGRTPFEAISNAALLRFRPIIMTTCAALLGGVPLALGTGVGSELRRPLGITIVGGLIFSQVLTLYTTPVIYLAFDRLARRFRRNQAPISDADLDRAEKDAEKLEHDMHHASCTTIKKADQGGGVSV